MCAALSSSSFSALPSLLHFVVPELSGTMCHVASLLEAVTVLPDAVWWDSLRLANRFMFGEFVGTALYTALSAGVMLSSAMITNNVSYQKLTMVRGRQKALGEGVERVRERERSEGPPHGTSDAVSACERAAGAGINVRPYQRLGVRGAGVHVLLIHRRPAALPFRQLRRAE